MSPSPGRQIRAPLKRWPSIRTEILLEEKYKADRPPFAPFPTVTDVVNAAFCPVAAVHNLLYGIDNALMRPEGTGAGALFHEFIANLKISLADGSCMPGGEKRLFDEFAEKKYDAAKEEGWMYVEYWLGRKMKDLRGLAGDIKTYFEVHVANDTINIEGGHCSYPLRGRIDELDMMKKRIVERTILGSDSDSSPPALKDFQLWLLWKLLCSIERKDRPEAWRSEDFEDYELVVETPYKDFVVPKNNRDFETMAHDAFSWIHDISSERFKFAIWEAWQNASCSYDSRNPDCSLLNRYCYRAKLKYPEGRKAMHADMRKFYTSLLYEQMWSHHLLMYQLMKLPVAKLSGWKIARGPAETLGNNKIIVKVIENPRSVLEQREEKESREVNVIFGTLRLGLFRKAVVEDFRNGKFTLKILGREPLPKNSNINIILSEVSFYREGPWFLQRMVQRETCELGLWGLGKEEKAKKHATVQLIDAIFWDKDLLAEKPKMKRGRNHAS